MEYGKVILGASLLIMALFFLFAHNAQADMFHMTKWIYLTNSSAYYVAGAVAALLGIFVLLLEIRQIKY